MNLIILTAPINMILLHCPITNALSAMRMDIFVKNLTMKLLLPTMMIWNTWKQRKWSKTCKIVSKLLQILRVETWEALQYHVPPLWNPYISTVFNHLYKIIKYNFIVIFLHVMICAYSCILKAHVHKNREDNVIKNLNIWILKIWIHMVQILPTLAHRGFKTKERGFGVLLRGLIFPH